jgi:hypothetical protein
VPNVAINSISKVNPDPQMRYISIMDGIATVWTVTASMIVYIELMDANSQSSFANWLWTKSTALSFWGVWGSSRGQ